MIEYDKVIAGRVRTMQPSGIRKFFEMLGDRPDVISLTVGQPDFVTPYHIREAAIRSIENGKTWYTANLGMPALREQISAYLARRFSLSYDAKKEILVSVGGSVQVIGYCIPLFTLAVGYGVYQFAQGRQQRN